MAEKTIPPSPNWYLSSASDANESGVYVYAARLNVYVLDISIPSAGPRMLRCYMGHTERVSSVALRPTPSPSDDVAGRAVQQPATGADGGDKNGGADVGNDFGAGVLCCSGGDDKAVKVWTVDTVSDVQSHNEHKVCNDTERCIVLFSCPKWLLRLIESMYDLLFRTLLRPVFFFSSSFFFFKFQGCVIYQNVHFMRIFILNGAHLRFTNDVHITK